MQGLLAPMPRRSALSRGRVAALIALQGVPGRASAGTPARDWVAVWKTAFGQAQCRRPRRTGKVRSRSISTSGATRAYRPSARLPGAAALKQGKQQWALRPPPAPSTPEAPQGAQLTVALRLSTNQRLGGTATERPSPSCSGEGRRFPVLTGEDSAFGDFAGHFILRAVRDVLIAVAAVWVQFLLQLRRQLMRVRGALHRRCRFVPAVANR
jgi:hypothetical protein